MSFCRYSLETVVPGDALQLTNVFDESIKVVWLILARPSVSELVLAASSSRNGFHIVTVRFSFVDSIYRIEFFDHRDAFQDERRHDP